jgi:hypothetical protein
VGGRTDSFAYYSKWKPRTCSIYLQRQRDPYSKWTDKGSVTNGKQHREPRRGAVNVLGEIEDPRREVDQEREEGQEKEVRGKVSRALDGHERKSPTTMFHTV